ncbi:hypothetical protein N9A15_04775 [Candidatus Pelagibacter sp.]|nr:hypothetical protein [Candidatus Pelagibacter sp.]
MKKIYKICSIATVSIPFFAEYNEIVPIFAPISKNLELCSKLSIHSDISGSFTLKNFPHTR